MPDTTLPTPTEAPAEAMKTATENSPDIGALRECEVAGVTYQRIGDLPQLNSPVWVERDNDNARPIVGPLASALDALVAARQRAEEHDDDVLRRCQRAMHEQLNQHAMDHFAAADTARLASAIREMFPFVPMGTHELFESAARRLESLQSELGAAREELQQRAEQDDAWKQRDYDALLLEHTQLCLDHIKLRSLSTPDAARRGGAGDETAEELARRFAVYAFDIDGLDSLNEDDLQTCRDFATWVLRDRSERTANA